MQGRAPHSHTPAGPFSQRSPHRAREVSQGSPLPLGPPVSPGECRSARAGHFFPWPATPLALLRLNSGQFPSSFSTEFQNQGVKLQEASTGADEAVLAAQQKAVPPLPSPHPGSPF